MSYFMASAATNEPLLPGLSMGDPKVMTPLLLVNLEAVIFPERTIWLMQKGQQ